MSFLPAPPPPPASRLPGCLFAGTGLATLGLGLVLLTLSGLVTWISGLADAADPGAVDQVVVRSRAALQAQPPGTALLLEGHLVRATPATPRPDSGGGAFPMVVWHQERFIRWERRKTRSGRREFWTPPDTVRPALLLVLADDDSGRVALGRGYALLGPLTVVQADTPAVRPSPRAGARGSWRRTGILADAPVTVYGRRSTGAAGGQAALDTLGSSAPVVYAGPVAAWRRASAAVAATGRHLRWGLLVLGAGLAAAGSLMLLLGWRQRGGAAGPGEPAS